jgi:hypothetical protein
MTKQLMRFDQIANTTNANLTIVLGSISDRANLGSNTVDVYANGAIVGAANGLNFINTSSVTVTAILKGDGNTNVAFTTAVPGVIIQVAASDLLSDLATTYTGVLPANIAYFRAPKAFTLTTLRASLGNAATTFGASNSCNIQIFMNGANVLTSGAVGGSGQLKFNQSSNTTVGATSPYVIANGTFVDDGLVAIQLCNVGAGANGLIITLIGS